MDLITQGILGAAVGQVYAQRTLGRRALAYGALIGMLPDADVLVRFSSNPFAEMLHHRGFTHSLFFAPLIAPILGWLLHRFYFPKGDFRTWTILSFLALITHPLLDVFTVYGTQLLNPFSNHRFALSAVPVIDPVYTGLLLIPVFIGMIKPLWQRLCLWLGIVALTLSSAYLFLGLAQNDIAVRHVEAELERCEKITPRVYGFTGIFSIFMRRIVVYEPHQIRVGFLSTLNKPEQMTWKILPKNDVALADPEIDLFTWFADHQIWHERHAHEITMHDLRFGLPIGSSEISIWGIRFHIDPVKLIKTSAAERITFRQKNDITWDNLKALWHFAFTGERLIKGDFSK